MSSPRAFGKLTWYSCNNGGCVEVAHHGDTVYIRDSKHPETTPLAFSVPEWESFREGIKSGAFDAI
jgi:hypothetical protein